MLKGAAALAAAAALWFVLRTPHDRFLVKAGAPILSILGCPAPGEMFVEKDSKFYFVIRRFDGVQNLVKHQELKVHKMHWNSMLFVALLLVTPLRLLRAGAGRFLLAAAILGASQLFFFVISTFRALDVVYKEQGVQLMAEPLRGIVVNSAIVYGAMIAPILPFLLYGFSARRAVKAAPAGGTMEIVAGRNDPCPCGSGKKFKRCCGSSVVK